MTFHGYHPVANSHCAVVLRHGCLALSLSMDHTAMKLGENYIEIYENVNIPLRQPF